MVPRANFLLGTMKHGPEGKFSPRDRGARSRGQIFSSGPWSTVPRADFFLGTWSQEKGVKVGKKNIELVQNGPILGKNP